MEIERQDIIERQNVLVDENDLEEEYIYFALCPICNKYCIPASNFRESNFCPICGRRIIWKISKVY